MSTQSYHCFKPYWARVPKCCIPSPSAICPLVPEKKIFKGFSPYMGVVVFLVM